MSNEANVILCPYCGRVQSGRPHRCQTCGGYLTPRSIQVTLEQMGPWQIRDKQVPFRPGCGYTMLVRLIERGKVTADTILRGPTTRGLWTLARRAPGVAHRVGFCDQCGKRVEQFSPKCPHCNVPFIQMRRAAESPPHEPRQTARQIDRLAAGTIARPLRVDDADDRPIDLDDQAVADTVFDSVLAPPSDSEQSSAIALTELVRAAQDFQTLEGEALPVVRSDAGNRAAVIMIGLLTVLLAVLIVILAAILAAD